MSRALQVELLKLYGRWMPRVLVLVLILVLALITFLPYAAWRGSGEPLTLDVPDGPGPAELPLMFLHTAFTVLPYALLAFLLAEAFRSTAAGVTGAMVYIFLEGIIVGILTAVGGTAADFRVLLFAHHRDAILELNRIGSVPFGGLILRAEPIDDSLPPPALAALALGAYSAALAALTYALFRYRDVRA